MTFHQSEIIGYLGDDPNLKYFDSGSCVCNFSVAVTERFRRRDQEEVEEKTTWYRVSVWGGQAESCNEYLQKGSQVFVLGTPFVSAYLSKETNEPVGVQELNARVVKFLSRSEKSKDSGSRSKAQEDDIPF